jgi:hypothetical protein
MVKGGHRLLLPVCTQYPYNPRETSPVSELPKLPQLLFWNGDQTIDGLNIQRGPPLGRGGSRTFFFSFLFNSVHKVISDFESITMLCGYL